MITAGKTSKFIILLLHMMLFSACGVDDSQSKYTQGDDFQHGHPTQWVTAGHSQVALDDRQFCDQCHNEDPVELLSSLSCRNCHIDGVPAVPITDICNSCHGSTPGNPPIRGSHVRHASAIGGHSYSCSLCHTVPGEPDLASHLDGNSSVDFSTADTRTAVASYSGTAVAFDAYGNCLNTYCHSDGTSLVTGSISSNVSPLWGTAYSEDYQLRCSSCHGGYEDGYLKPTPVYERGNPKANSHKHHENRQCKTCHNLTIIKDLGSDSTEVIFDPLLHVNQSYNVDPNTNEIARKLLPPSPFDPPTYIYVFFDYDPVAAQCLNNACHPGDDRYW
ncbi:MAG TPA: hypothetical protein DCS42_12360 [Nitrospiraceae bacterium]|jgi:predicted CxxxxCH...CXXCH cytochrome family protein|nr:hypothetical protein [Nitrospiraceae bacterium]